MSDIAERVKKIVVEHLSVEEDKVTENASFIDDLGADSLDTPSNWSWPSRKSSASRVPDDAAETIQDFGDAVKFHQGRPVRPVRGLTVPAQVSIRQDGAQAGAVFFFVQGTARRGWSYRRDLRRSDPGVNLPSAGFTRTV